MDRLAYYLINYLRNRFAKGIALNPCAKTIGAVMEERSDSFENKPKTYINNEVKTNAG